MKNAIWGLWDLTRETPTLGGALTLRQELELLSDEVSADNVRLSVNAAEAQLRFAEFMIQQIFGSSRTAFDVVLEDPVDLFWPAKEDLASGDFSYFGLSRLISLCGRLGKAPVLRWNDSVSSAANGFRSRFSERLIAIHLRFVPPFSEVESCANGVAWGKFLTQFGARQNITFVLLGDDELPPGVNLGAGVVRALDLELPLAVQLALVGQCDGFIGMASGICNAAVFSPVPYVIFKHPEHHVAEMRRELGVRDRLPFAADDQMLLRREANYTSLTQALGIVLARNGAQQ